MNTALAVKILIACLIVIFIVRQISAWKKLKFIRLIATPLITYIICGLAIIGQFNYGSDLEWLIVAALGLSLIADSVLMIERRDLFTHGLIFFLGTHILYNICFAYGYSFIWRDIPAGVVLLGLMAFLMYRFVNGGILEKKMIAPVVVYMLALSLIVFFSINGYLRTGEMSYALRALGAVLFYVSDAILGWTQFVKHNRLATLYVWFFYAPGQFVIAMSLMF